MFVRAEAHWVREHQGDSSDSEVASLSSSEASVSDLASQNHSREDNDLTWDDFDEGPVMTTPQSQYVGPARMDWARMSSEGTSQIEITHLPGPNAAAEQYFDSDDVFDTPTPGTSQATEPQRASPSSRPSSSPARAYLSPEASQDPSVALSLRTRTEPPSSRQVTPSRIPVRVTPTPPRQSGRLQQKSPVNYRGLHSRGRRGQH